MTAVQVTMVAACLAVVSCEPPVITQAYGVPSVDSYSPSYSSGGYGGGGGGGYDGGHHGGHETVGRGVVVSTPGHSGEVVSSGGSESSGQTSGGLSAEEDTPSSGIARSEGVNSLGGSGNRGQTKGIPGTGIPVLATLSGQLDKSSIGRDGYSGDKDRFSGSGDNVADSTVSPALDFEPDTTISGVQDETILPRDESVYSTQPEPTSGGSIDCTGGATSLAESGISKDNDGHSIRGESFQVGAQTDTYVNGAPDSTYYNNDVYIQKVHAGIHPDEDTSVSRNENTYYPKRDSISSGQHGSFFNVGIDRSESDTNTQIDVNDLHQYQTGLLQSSKDISGQREMQNNAHNSPIGGISRCSDAQTYINGDSSVQTTEYERSYTEYKPELIGVGLGNKVQEGKQDSFFSDDTYKSSDVVGPWFSGSDTPRTQDKQQDDFTEERVAKRVITINQPSGRFPDTNTNGGIVSRNENSDDKKYSAYSTGRTGSDYTIPEQPRDGCISNNNNLNTWEKSRDGIDQNSFSKLEHGIIQRESGNLPRGRSSKTSGYKSWVSTRYGRILPVVINEVHEEHTNTGKSENRQAMLYGDPHENVLTGSIHDSYKHVNGDQFQESPINNGVDISHHFITQTGNKGTSVVNQESWSTKKNVDYGKVQPSSSIAENNIIDDQVKYASMFQNYFSGTQSPHTSSLRGHFIVASVPNATKPSITSHNHDWGTSNYGIHSRQARGGTSSWNVLHLNTLLEPPIAPQLKPKPAIEGYPGYLKGGYSVREEDTNSGEHYGGLTNPGYSSQERSHSPVTKSGGIGEEFVNYQGLWKNSRASSSNNYYGPNYPTTTNFPNSFAGINHNTQGNQPFSENKLYYGSSGILSQSTGSQESNTGGHPLYGVGESSNKQDVNSSSIVGTSSNEENTPFPETRRYPGYGTGWIGQTYGGSNRSQHSSIGKQASSGPGINQGYDSSGVNDKYNSGVYGHSIFGSVGNVDRQGLVYSYNQGSSNPKGNSPSPGTGGYQGYGSGGVAQTTYSLGGHEKHVTIGSGGYGNHQGVGISNNQGTTSAINKQPSSRAGGYQGYGTTGVAGTYSSGQAARFGSSGNVNQRGVGYNYNNGYFTPISNQPHFATGNYQGYESEAGSPGADTSSAGVSREHTYSSTGGHLNQQGVGYNHKQVYTTSIGKQPSPGTGGYLGYGAGGVSENSSLGVYGQQDTFGSSGYANKQGVKYSYNQGPYTSTSNQPTLTGNYQGHGTTGENHTSKFGVDREQTDSGSGWYVNQQGMGFRYDQSSTSPIGKQPFSGTGGYAGYQGYGAGRVAETSSSGVHGQQATFSSSSYANQQGLGNSNQGTLLGTHPYISTGDYQGYGSAGEAHTSNSGSSREQTATGSGSYEGQQGVRPNYNQDSLTHSGDSSPKSGGYQGYGSSGVSHTSSSGQHDKFGFVGSANQQGVGYSSNQGYSKTTAHNPSQRTGGIQGYGKDGVAQTSTSTIHGAHAIFGSGLYGNKSRVDYIPTKTPEIPDPGPGGYSGYEHGGVSQSFGSREYNDGVGYSSSGDTYKLNGNKHSTPMIGGPSGYGLGGSGGGYWTVWKDVGGWKNFTVRPAGFLGYGLSAKPYQFGYAVKDQHTGADFHQQEQSDGNTVKGQYRVALPDGRTQIVTYTADWKTGFHADVRYEGEASYPAVWGGSGGYAPSGAPSSNYGAPSSNYGAPSSNYRAPSSNYGAPAGGTGSQYNNIGHSAGGYGHGGYRK